MHVFVCLMEGRECVQRCKGRAGQQLLNIHHAVKGRDAGGHEPRPSAVVVVVVRRRITHRVGL